jgi:hypothetical protein
MDENRTQRNMQEKVYRYKATIIHKTTTTSKKNKQLIDSDGVLASLVAKKNDRKKERKIFVRQALCITCFIYKICTSRQA